MSTSGSLPEVKVNGLEIAVPKGSAFAIETPPMMPKAHFLCAVIAPRGYGKGLITTALIEKMKVIDRLIVVSPSASSNKALLDRLKKILKDDDIYPDVNNIRVIDDIIAKVDGERDDYEDYLAQKRLYEKMKGKIKHKSPLCRLDVSDIMNPIEDLKPPKHKWGGRLPVICIWLDDIFGSQLMLGNGARKVSELCIKHRHLGQLKEGGAVGASLIFNMQAYKSAQGGLPRALRGNLTLLLVGKMKSEKDLESIAEEVAGEVSNETFYRVFAQAIDRPHAFLMIDMHPKKEHPSQFRRGLDTFIVPKDEGTFVPIPKH